MTRTLEGSRFFIKTFGCQMNENDSEHLAGLLAGAGAAKAGSLEDSDLVIVNTCAVRGKSEEKAASFLGRLSALQKKHDVVIAVAGCSAQLRRGELLRGKPRVDLIIGPGRYHELPALLAERTRGGRVATGRSRAWREIGPDATLREDPSSAYVPIMEGCDNFCAYCVVPFARGREKCRPMERVLAEVADAAAKGYKEVQLLGQNVNSYRDPGAGAGFAVLLDRVSRIGEIAWVRFLTSHPRDLSPEIARVMADRPTVCRQIHLPLQSGSSVVLEKMNRGYTRDEYMEKIAMLKTLMPGISLSTDVIVGFPGETEADFEATLSALEEVGYANIFSFRYSPRPRTAAAKLPDDVLPGVKRRRLIVLQDLQKRLQLERNRSFVGTTIRVLGTGVSRKGESRFTGRSEGFQVVNFTA
ncbi:MAG TPA: tRNA (N6-isopentenyl adenosine(37)-C2)-methylthiotransferase MiaB, partial [Acidobacteriota bacterium]|nr:tRNA (N6-isopentenyl adenosine(37)-C2)-methylthiotransferase MiaB [Acidobacteriota bacterium]